MTRLSPLILLTFVEGVATVLIQRAVYFYTRVVLDYSDIENLLLALAIGSVYVVGAGISHRLAERFGKKRLLVAAVCGLITSNLVMAACPRGIILIFGVLLAGTLNGCKWPLVESYVGGGCTPQRLSSAIGKFSLAWSLAMPVALVCAGPLIELGPRSLFLSAATLNLLSLSQLRSIHSTTKMSPPDIAHRPGAVEIARYERLLASSRWTMLNSYALMFILAPLFPGIFAGLGVSVFVATGLSAIVDALRITTFFAMQHFSGWQGRVAPTLATIFVLPAAFLLILFGRDLTSVLVGEALFGVAAGCTYYAALYYAMVSRNASVDAGGSHEQTIGAGVTLGPIAGLAGKQVAGMSGHPVLGMLAGVAPIMIYTAYRAMLALVSPSPLWWRRE